MPEIFRIFRIFRNKGFDVITIVHVEVTGEKVIGRGGLSPYSVRMRGNADQNNSEHGHLLRSEVQTITRSSHVRRVFIFMNGL